MSLPLGGLFDIDNNWQPEHKSHRYGANADIEWNVGAGSSCRALSPDELDDLAIVIWFVTGKAPRIENNHFHLNRF